MSNKDLSLTIEAYNKSKPAFRAVKNDLKEVENTSAKVTSAMKKGWRAVGKVISVATGFIKTAIKLAIIPLTILTAGFGLAIREAGAFEQGMANVASVLGSTGKELDMLSNAARKMGRTTVFTALQATEAMYNLGSAGLNANQVVSALDGTMLLAAATASELAFTTASVAATIKQFGLEAADASRVANVFAASISYSMLTMQKLTDAMVYAGPVAGALGQSLEGTVAMLMNFANQGLRGSQIGTSIRMGMAQLGRAVPAKELENGAQVLKRLGIAFSEVDPNIRSFADIVEALEGKLTKLQEAQALFGVRGGASWFKAIKDGSAALREQEKRITATKKAQEMARIQITTFCGALRLLKSAASAAAEGLGRAFLPAVTAIVKEVTSLVNVIGKIDWVSAWKGFKEGTDTGVKQLNKIIDLFREGGSIRGAILDWVNFFARVVANLAAIVWRPLGTELKVVFMGIMDFIFGQMKKIADKLSAFHKKARFLPILGLIAKKALAAAEAIKEFVGKTDVKAQQKLRASEAKKWEEDFKAIFSTFRNGLTGPVESTKKAAKDFAEAINSMVQVVKKEAPKAAEAIKAVAATAAAPKHWAEGVRGVPKFESTIKSGGFSRSMLGGGRGGVSTGIERTAEAPAKVLVSLIEERESLKELISGYSKAFSGMDDVIAKSTKGIKEELKALDGKIRSMMARQKMDITSAKNLIGELN